MLSTIQPGKVYLVGSGPGDPGLITLRGMRLLQVADVVMYDYLCNPELLAHVRPTAVVHCLGSHSEGKVWKQDQINAEMIRQAEHGHSVVRLKSGDPTVFARAADEITALVERGIEVEIVPGVTSALAAGAYTGIPVTHAKHASAVAFITGQEKLSKASGSVDYEALAKFPGTLVFYMGVTTGPVWSAGLIAGGKSPETPVAMIRRCTWPDQETTRCTLGEVAEHLHPGSKIRPPVIVVVGDVAGEGEACRWFESRPLFGQRIVITRPEHQVSPLRDQLTELGAAVIPIPAIEIGPPEDWGPVDKAIARLKDFDWLVFSSRNGVRYFFERLLSHGGDIRKVGHLKLGAIGPGTAEALTEYHLTADVIPPEYRAESMVEALQAEARGKRFLLPRASRGRDVLPEGLKAAGAEVEEVVVYHSGDTAELPGEAQRQLESGPIDWVMITSSAIARSSERLLGETLRTAKVVSISPITSATLRELGIEPAAEATEYTMDGMVAAMLKR